jgi:hypothetical protein
MATGTAFLCNKDAKLGRCLGGWVPRILWEEVDVFVTPPHTQGPCDDPAEVGPQESVRLPAGSGAPPPARERAR